MAEAIKGLNLASIDNPTKKIVHNKNKIIVRRNRLLALIYSSFFILSLVSAIFILSNYEKITDLNFEINQKDVIIESAKKSELNLQAKIEEIKSDRDIVDEARIKLGMVFPEKNQVVYFTLAGNEDQEENTDNKGIISSIFSTFIGKRN